MLALGARAGLCSPEAQDEHRALLDRAGLAACAAESGLRVQAYRTFLLGLNQLAVLG